MICVLFSGETISYGGPRKAFKLLSSNLVRSNLEASHFVFFFSLPECTCTVAMPRNRQFDAYANLPDVGRLLGLINSGTFAGRTLAVWDALVLSGASDRSSDEVRFYGGLLRRLRILTIASVLRPG